MFCLPLFNRYSCVVDFWIPVRKILIFAGQIAGSKCVSSVPIVAVKTSQNHGILLSCCSQQSWHSTCGYSTLAFPVQSSRRSRALFQGSCDCELGTGHRSLIWTSRITRAKTWQNIQKIPNAIVWCHFFFWYNSFNKFSIVAQINCAHRPESKQAAQHCHHIPTAWVLGWTGKHDTLNVKSSS